MKFGDIIINHTASDNNPLKRAIVVRTGNRSGRLNPGPYVECTDGKGKFWTVQRGEWLEVVGSVLAKEPPYRLRSFWSPCKRYLVTAYAPIDDISLMDDDGTIWNPTGPEQDAAQL